MRRSMWVLVGSVVLAAAVPWAASAETIFEVEHARNTARVGGPVSDRDAELLDRWGAHSGTPDWRRPAQAGPFKESGR
ncbi:MAG: hypothetical protein AB1749_17075 [Pseudomonadota bacterium]